jgi:hypothetical protein
MAAAGWGKRSPRGNTGLERGKRVLKVAFYDVADVAAMLAALDQVTGTSERAIRPSLAERFQALRRLRRRLRSRAG